MKGMSSNDPGVFLGMAEGMGCYVKEYYVWDPGT